MTICSPFGEHRNVLIFEVTLKYYEDLFSYYLFKCSLKIIR